MTINGGQPHKVGYIGQKYRIVVDSLNGDQVHPFRIGWTDDNQNQKLLRSLEARPNWIEARYEEVTDPASENEPWPSEGE